MWIHGFLPGRSDSGSGRRGCDRLCCRACIAGRRRWRIRGRCRSPRPSETATRARRCRGRLIDGCVPFRAIRERAAVTLGQRIDACAGERREVEHQLRAARARRARACRRAPCGLRHRCARPEWSRRSRRVTTSCGRNACAPISILGDGEPAIDVVTARRARLSASSVPTATALPCMSVVHVVHALVRFEIDAAGIEADAFADQREVLA